MAYVAFSPFFLSERLRELGEVGVGCSGGCQRIDESNRPVLSESEDRVESYPDCCLK